MRQTQTRAPSPDTAHAPDRPEPGAESAKSGKRKRKGIPLMAEITTDERVMLQEIAVAHWRKTGERLRLGALVARYIRRGLAEDAPTVRAPAAGRR